MVTIFKSNNPPEVIIPSEINNSAANSKEQGFTLLELIVVIIIIGILAVLGFSQYNLVVEKGRTAEGRAVMGVIRSAQIAYNQEYGTYGAMANLPVSAPTSCTSTHFFRYTSTGDITNVCGGWQVAAVRCTTGGKQPTGPYYVLRWCLDTSRWSNDAPY